MKKTAICAAAFLFLIATARAQFINEHGPQAQPGRDSAVEFLAPDMVSVPVAKPTKVALHFRVQPGLHVNSHTPHDEFLIPTALSLPESKGVRLLSVAYPQGSDVTLPADPRTRLNVYTGNFVLDATFVAALGEHVVQAMLRFQACDQRQCMPPKTLPVTIVVTGN